MTVEKITVVYTNQFAGKCHRKQGTKVTAVDGRSVVFAERMSKREAIRQASKHFARQTAQA